MDLLKGLLTTGTASASPQPAMLPLSPYLALIATLAVHPTLTTRAKSLDRVQAANLAIQYLQVILNHINPTADVIRDALVFAGQGKKSRRRSNARRRTNGENVSPTTEHGEAIGTDLADAESLWTRAEDFWQLVGWSFNCSVMHKHRWEIWHGLLTFMVDLLVMDWNARKANSDVEALGGSLLVRYINSSGAVAGRERRILRAVFADGKSKAMAEFGEIWQNETRLLKKDSQVKKADVKIDIEADKYGDYMEDENDADLEDSDSDRSSPVSDTDGHSPDFIPNIAQGLGGMDAIHLRIRLLALLSRCSEAIPDAFTPLNNLYHIFHEQIRYLPIPVFFAVISPNGLCHWEPTAASTLTQYILRSIIVAAAPLPPNDNLSQDILEKSYLPFAANTNSIVDNTKVSLCIETLIRLLERYCGLEWTPELQQRVEAGIQARNSKVKVKQTKTDRQGNCDRTWLTSSAERIRIVVELARP